MTALQNEILSCVKNTISEFNIKEKYLLQNDLSERCICAKFASYLEREITNFEFDGYDYVVDVEYNRGYEGNGSALKRLNGRNIVVDLIVHIREYDNISGFNNLFCIEMKKAYKNYDLSHDKERLCMLTCLNYGFGYKAGYMIIIDNKDGDYNLSIESSYYLE